MVSRIPVFNGYFVLWVMIMLTTHYHAFDDGL
jgi:hypothetical protein